MICQATYDSLDVIPDTLRDEFHQVNGKWQLKDTAVPGVGQLFNAALAANETKAVDQVKKRNETIRQLQEENNGLKDKLSVLDTPGNKVLSKEDATLFDNYIKMGTPKEVETKLTEHGQLTQKVSRFEATETLGKIAKAGVKINPDVLADWAMSAEAEGVKFFVKSVEQPDGKGGKITVEVPYARIEKKNGDQVEVSERELLPFAKESLPEWKYAALTVGIDTKPVIGSVQPPKVNTGVRVPDLGSASAPADNSGGKKRPVDRFNEEREGKPNPFSKPIPQIGGGALGRVTG